MSQKIAAITEDTQRISSHFGRAHLYLVFTVEDGEIVAQETRDKAYHGSHTEGHSHDHSRHNHDDMFAPIEDCQVLICGGMGEPAYQKAKNAGLEVILAGGEISQAVQSYLHGELNSDLRRIHRH